MIYRPQFAYPTPDGCRDLDFVYYFDGSNTQMLNQNFSGLDLSASTGGIPLVTEQDAPFYWRGIKVGPLREQTAGAPTTYVSNSAFTVRFRDAYDNFLSDDMVPAIEYGLPSNPQLFNNSRLTGPPVPIAEIYCPPGSTLWLFLNVPTVGGGVSVFPEVALYGVKRFKECQ